MASSGAAGGAAMYLARRQANHPLRALGIGTVKVYTYWAPGEAVVEAWAPGEAVVEAGRRPWTLRAYGGSDNSLDDAKWRAREVAERAAAAIARGQPPGAYGYADRPLREEILEQIRDAGDLAGVITRNASGSLVLNTSRVMFVDVDYPRDTSRASSAGPNLADVVKQWWGRLTGQGSAPPAVPEVASRDDRLLTRFEQVTRSQPGLGIRVYRTAGGFRLLVTSGPLDPTAAQSADLLSAYGSDTLFLRLCKVQQCFRARLSAKFWRCGATKPPSRFPWADTDEESRYRNWEQEYHLRANRHATCAFVGSFGDPTVHAAVEPILEVHDRLTINDGAPLA